MRFCLKVQESSLHQPHWCMREFSALKINPSSCKNSRWMDEIILFSFFFLRKYRAAHFAKPIYGCVKQKAAVF